MLAASRIPADRQFVGTLADVVLSASQFDYIFLLGVTTYIGDEDLTDTLITVHELLAPEGRAIVTFTNRTSADWMMRRMIRKIPGIRRRKQFVLAQEFPTYARSMTEIERIISELFSIERSVGLNHTVFPFNQLLKRPSVRIAKRIHRSRNGAEKLLLSSDILVELAKK
jgi:cyclopropane fatty-acyl-phospholipid synthase-like methyltransferase